MTEIHQQQFEIALMDRENLTGLLSIPSLARGVVIFADTTDHGQLSAEVQQIADHLYQDGLGIVVFHELVSLLPSGDRQTNQATEASRMAETLGAAVDWLKADADTRRLDIGIFGLNTGATAALISCSQRSGVKAVVGAFPGTISDAVMSSQAAILILIRDQDAENFKLPSGFEGNAKIKTIDTADKDKTAVQSQIAIHAADWFVQHLEGAVER